MADSVQKAEECCFNVFDYENVIRALFDLRSTYKNIADGTLKVRINGIAGTEVLKLEVKEGAVSVLKTRE